MTPRERYLAFASFQPVDRVPRRADFYIESVRQRLREYLGKDLTEAFPMDAGRGAGLRPPEGYTFPDYSRYHPGRKHGEKGFSIDGNGCGHQNHGFYHFTEYLSPLREAERFEELQAYPIVSNAGWLDDQMAQAARDARAQGFAATAWIGHMYENAWQVRGYEPFLEDLLLRREWAELLLDRFCDNNVRAATAAARHGYDCINLGDDIANQNDLMFSPAIWRAVMKPRWAKVIAAARALKPDIHVWYHSDGDIQAVLDEIVEIGIDILNPVQPECMDPLAVRKRYGKRLAFDGCVGTQTTFPFGTPAEMRRVVLDLGRALNARQGGLMLSPTHVLEPEVPPENVVAFFQACDEL
jgi:uroporphyrinogen decarboxylase